MVFDGWLRVGGNEIINSPRAEGVTRTYNCSVNWIRGNSCGTLQGAIGDGAYSYQNIAAAPWYDPTNADVSSRVLGVYGLGFSGVKDSTRQVQVTEGLDDGGVIGVMRKGVRQVRARINIITDGDDAMEYARTWLEAALDPGACGQHGEECGATDVEYLATCPPTRKPSQTDDQYAASVDSLRRYLHEVAVTSGPLLVQENKRREGSRTIVSQVVEFTFTAGRPWIYGVTKVVDLPSTTPFVVEDIQYNAAPYPSMELAGTPVTVSTNLSVNPSVETNATGWNFVASSPITTGMLAGVRDTALAAVGLASYRVTCTASTSGSAGAFGATQTVALPASPPARARYSINMWAAVVVATGSPTIANTTFIAEWLDASNAVLRTDALGNVLPAGGVVSVAAILPPATATQVRVTATCNVTNFASGNVIRLYADALGVTTP